MTTITRLDRHTFRDMLNTHKLAIIRNGVAEVTDPEFLLGPNTERFAIVNDDNGDIRFVIAIHELSTWQAYELRSGYWWLISRGIVHMAPSCEFFDVPHATEAWYEDVLKPAAASVREIIQHYLQYGMQYRYPYWTGQL